MTIDASTSRARDPALLACDFDALEPGLRFVTRGRTVTESDIVSFAALTGDWHPQHADAAWAAESRFGERVAHGMLVLSYAVGMVPLDPERVVALRRVGDAVFKRPVRLGDTIHVEGRIEGLTPLDDEVGLVATGWAVLNQDGATVARVAIDVVWRREAGASGERTAPAQVDRGLVVPL
jgi:3-hydroxybutyryl-CoA dehydratase